MAAVASYYAHPTPAIHPHQYQKTRGHRMCDTCGAVEELGQRFRMCGGCMTTQVRIHLYYLAPKVADVERYL